MKINPKYILIFSFLHFAISGYAKVSGSSKEKIEQLERVIEECHKSINTIKSEIEEKEETYNKLQAQLEGKRQEEERLQNEIDKINNVIEYLEGNLDENANKKIEHLELTEELSYLKNKMAELSTNFLFTPYEEYCIDVVAIPDFQMGKGTLYYTEHSYRGDLLRHYKQDWEKVKEFLEANQYTTATNAGAVKDKLLNLPTLIQYAGGINPKTGKIIPGYGEGWEQTYLGKIMSGLLKILNNTRQKDATAKIISTFETYLNMMK